MDNIMVTFETMHTVEGVTTGNDHLLALKLDTSKAYDWVEWDFLQYDAANWIYRWMDSALNALYYFNFHFDPT